MNTDAVVAVAFFGAVAFGAAGIVLAFQLIRRGWTLKALTIRHPIRH